VNGAWAMPFTIRNLPKLFKEKVMTYEEQAQAWIQSSPYVDIPVGRFTLRFKLSADRDWVWSWEYMSWLVPDDFLDSPEQEYFFNLFDDSNASMHDMDFIDVLLKEMQEKPFNQGENK